MRISDCISDVCSSDLEGNKAGYAQFGQQPLYVLHISQRHICHWVLGVAAFGTTAHFRTDKPPLPRQPVCQRLEVAGISGRSDESRGGEECDITGSMRMSQYVSTTKKSIRKKRK